MKNIGNMSPENGPKKSQWEKDFESFPFIKKPFEQWSDEEKETFFDHWSRGDRLNNFYSTVFGVLDEKRLEKDDGIPMKKHYGLSEEEVAEQIKSGENSGKYYNNSSVAFQRAIRQALIDNNINLQVLEEILSENEISRRAMIDDVKLFEKEGGFKKKINNMSRFYLLVLPAVFNLLNSGYTETELHR